MNFYSQELDFPTPLGSIPSTEDVCSTEIIQRVIESRLTTLEPDPVPVRERAIPERTLNPSEPYINEDGFDFTDVDTKELRRVLGLIDTLEQPILKPGDLAVRALAKLEFGAITATTTRKRELCSIAAKPLGALIVYTPEAA